MTELQLYITELKIKTTEIKRYKLNNGVKIDTLHLALSL